MEDNNDIVIETENLTKKYGSAAALKDVSLSLRSGHIYGFIGDNGAGKTTLLRLIAGLAFPTSGTLSLFGKHTRGELEQVRRHIGSTIEAPALYPDFTAMQNMQLQRRLLGHPDPAICERMLELVGLDARDRKKVKHYSMGMKQRLGLALALIGKPEILLLDEPVNGLDPKGITEIRDLLKKLNQDFGTTILISSHILAELYLLATDYIIISKGRIVDALSLDELSARCRQYVSIHMDNVPLGLTVIEQRLSTTDYQVMEDGTVHLYSHVSQLDTIARLLQDNGILVTGLSVSEQTLEEYYLKVTGGGRNV